MTCRWKKSLHPARERVGRWIEDEDKRLKVAVMLFGPKNWNKIAQFVPGRTQVQCRERWVNSLDPSLSWSEWTEEEDSKLKAAIAEHGYCWAKVAACVPPRTDNQCRRRWKVLLPHEVPMLKEARRIQKAALISNFVDREVERPALGPSDFLPLPMIGSISEPENKNSCSKQKGRLRGKATSKEKKNAASCNVPRKNRFKKCEQQSQVCSGTIEKKKHPKPCSKRKKCIKPVADNQSLVLLPESLESGTTNGKQRPTKLQSKRKKCMELAEDSHSFSSHPESGEFGKTDGEGVESSILDMGKGAVKQQKRRKIRNEPSGKCQDVSVLFQQDKLEVSKHRNISSKQILGATNGDDVTLACFLHNKPKKRRLEVAKNTSQACSSSSPKKGVESLSNVADKLKYGNQNLSTTQDKESQAFCLGGNPDDLLPCKLSSHLVDKPTMIDSDNGPDRKDLVQGQHTAHDPVSFSPEGDCEEDGDITLACLLQNKLKKKKGSKSISRVNRHNDGNPSNMQG
ncbi:transcription factor myb3r-3 [Quercus suber]|uniref:Transcription factor myb3r-3 n=1 Tax=Quercus suber TaxID=58331 RepID=A0AAW0L1C6_QUESU